MKIEKQTTPGTWVDVTLEILSLGINSAQLPNANTGGSTCTDYTPNAILRLQRPWDNSGTCYSAAQLMANGNANASRYVDNSLYDPREALLRDSAPSSMQFGGIMHYVEIDARNLSRWFQGTIPAGSCPIACSGSNALNLNGYTVYFSDRRGNRNASDQETAEFGFEDIVNPGVQQRHAQRHAGHRRGLQRQRHARCLRTELPDSRTASAAGRAARRS